MQARIPRVSATHAERNCEGSCAIDQNLLDAADIQEFDAIDIYGVTNGERFPTYAIRAERDSRIVSAGGATARRAAVRDILIIACCSANNERELKKCEPKLVYVDGRNRILREGNAIPLQMAG